jgi:hypothetical protein
VECRTLSELEALLGTEIHFEPLPGDGPEDGGK